jgi:NADH pyrophosphatase NudC (nudix superfamily)
VETGESFSAAMIRETLEETAWHVEPVAVTGIYRWQIPGTEQTYFRHCFAANPREYDASLKLDDGILNAIWLSYDELHEREKELRSPLVLASIDDYQSGTRYPLHLFQDIQN